MPDVSMQDLKTMDKKSKKPRLFVQGLPVETTERDLEELFETIGQVLEVSIVPPKKGNQNTTYGFVTYDSFDDAQIAVDKLDEIKFHLKILKVAFSKETQREYNLQMDEDDEDDFYDKLYDDVDFPPPDVIPAASKEINGTDGINGDGEKVSCKDVVRGMMFTDLPVKPFPDDLVFSIYTTEVVSLKSFYGQLVTADTVASLQELSNQLSLFKSYEAVLPPSHPKINELCVAKFKEDQEWYRAFPLRYIDDDNVEVFFVDYGNKSNVNYKNIRCINERLLNFPRYAMNFAIDSIQDETPEMKEKMTSLLLNKPTCVTCISIEGDTMMCDVDLESGVRLVDALKGVADEPEPKIMFLELPAQVINSSMEFEVAVVCVNSLSDIAVWIGDYCSIQSKVEEISALLFEKITSTCGDFAPVVGEVCAGFNEEYQEWYRIHILEILSDGNVNAKLIDYGYDNVFKTRHLASFPDESFCVAPQASTMSLSDALKDCTDSTFSLLKKHICEKRVVVHVDKYTDRYIVRKIFTNDGVDVFSTLLVTDAPKLPSEKEADLLDKVPLVKKEDLLVKVSLKKEEDALPKIKSDLYDIDVYTKLPAVVVPEQCSVMITHVSSPSLVYGQVYDENTIEKNFELKVDLNDYCSKNEKIHKPSLSELCCAFFEEEWCRVCVIELKQKSARVFFIDYGNHEDIEYINIRHCPNDYLLIPSLAVPFQLEESDLVSDSEENTSQLKERLENEISTVTVRNRSNDPIIISIDGLSMLDFFERLECEDKELTEKEKLELSIQSLEENMGSLGTDSNEVETTPKGDIDADSLDNSFDLSLDSKDSGTNEKFSESSLPPEIHPLEAVELKMDLTVLPDNVARLLITHVETPWQIFGVSMDETMTSKVDEMLLKLNEFYSDSSPCDAFRLKAGVLCAAIDSTSKWARGLIRDVKVSNCSVFFVDTGKSFSVPHESIRSLDKQFKVPRAQAILMKLLTVRPLNGEEDWSDEANDHFCGMINGQVVRALLKYRKGILNNVKLKIDENDVVVDKLFEDGGYAEKYTPDIYKDFSLHDISKDTKLSKISIPFDQVAKVIQMEKAPDTSFLGIITCVVSPRLFYARIYDDSKLSKVDNMSEELKRKYGDAPFNGAPLKPGELCAVQLRDDCFYRGYIMEQKAGSTESLVWLIDYGTTFYFTPKEIWPLPDDMKSLPGQAFTMQLSDILPMKEKELYPRTALKVFQSMIIDKIMKIEIKSVTEHMNRVSIFDAQSGLDIADLLVRKGFAKYYYRKGPSSSNKITKPRHQPLRNLMDVEVPSSANFSTQAVDLTNTPMNSNDLTSMKKKKKKKKKKGESTNENTEDVNEEYIKFSYNVGPCEKCLACNCNSRVNDENSFPHPGQPVYRYPYRGPFYDEWGPCYPPQSYYEENEMYLGYQGGYNPNYQSNSYPIPCSSPRYRYFENGYPDPYCFNQDRKVDHRKKSPQSKVQYLNGFVEPDCDPPYNAEPKLLPSPGIGRGRWQVRGRTQGRGRGRGC